MEYPTDFSREMRIDAERKLLVTLCQSALNSETRAAIVIRLNNYTFVEPDHQVVYRALGSVRALDPTEARQALTQTVTRLGFPDLDLNWLFNESALIPNEVAPLLERL